MGFETGEEVVLKVRLGVDLEMGYPFDRARALPRRKERMAVVVYISFEE